MNRIIEIDKTDISKFGGAVHAFRNGAYRDWTEAQIKGAFNFGRGTLADFARYRRDNSRYARWYVVVDDVLREM